MKNVKSILTKSSRNFLFLLLLILSSSLHAQKNAIKVTPIKPVFDKINIGYERFFKKDWSITADAQFWFRDEEGVEPDYLGPDIKYNNQNKGFRSAIELRKYFTKTKGKIKYGFNVGVSAYLGKHHVETTEYGYTSSSFSWFGIESSPNYVPPFHGAVDILSGGIAGHIGYRILWEKGLFINAELIRRKSWTNHGSDEYTLLPEDASYPFEKTNSFDPFISGIVIEPKLSVGYMF